MEAAFLFCAETADLQVCDSNTLNLLNIPEKYEFPCVLALGYPGSNARTFKPDPIAIEERIHTNTWGKVNL